MATLYEIDQAITDCVDMDTGEIIDAEALEALQIERDEKIEKVALWYKNLKSDADAYKAEADNFTARYKSASTKAESIKGWIDNALSGEKFKTTKVNISYRKPESVNCPDEESFIEWAEKNGEDYLKYSTPELNKTNIKNALKSGATVGNCELTKKQNIQIK